MTITNPATISDVTSRAFRSLSTEETAAATVLVDDAWFLLIGSYVGDSVLAALATTNADDEPITPDPKFVHNVKRLVGNAVLRVVNNPTGNLETEGDDYRERKDSAVSSGALYFSDVEIGQLFPTNGSEQAFTIRPGRLAELRDPLPEDPFWTPIA